MTRANDPRGTAIALSFGYFDRPSAKTAHGLIRGGERFDIIGLVDSKLRLPSAKWPVLPPVFASVAEALRALPVRPQFAIVGVAFTGGRLPEAFRADIAMVLRAGVSVVSGLHELLGEDVAACPQSRKSSLSTPSVRNSSAHGRDRQPQARAQAQSPRTG